MRFKLCGHQTLLLTIEVIGGEVTTLHVVAEFATEVNFDNEVIFVLAFVENRVHFSGDGNSNNTIRMRKITRHVTILG